MKNEGSTIGFVASHCYEVGDILKIQQPPATKWWRRIEAWRRVFGFKPRTWRKRYRILSVTATSLEVEPND